MYQTWASMCSNVATDLIFTLGYLARTEPLDRICSQSTIFHLRFRPGPALETPSQVDRTQLFGYGRSVTAALSQYQNINTAAFGENHGQLTYEACSASSSGASTTLNLLASYTVEDSHDTGNIIGGSLGGAYTANIQNPPT